MIDSRKLDIDSGGRPASWERTTLGELARRSLGTIQTGPFGSQLHASDYVTKGVPVVMPVNIGDNQLLETDVVRIREQDAERLSRHRLRAGDIVYSRRGDVERRALVRPGQEGWLCGTGCLLVRVGGREIDSRYVSYWLGNPSTRAWISRHAVGATMPNLNTNILSDVPAVLPPIALQRGIAATLGALDDKVESNRRQQELLDQLIQANYAAIAKTVEDRLRLDELATLTKGVSYKSVDLQPSRTALVTLKSFSRDGGYKPIGLKPYVGPWKPAQQLYPGEIAVAQTDLTQSADVVGRAVRVPSATDHDTLVASLDLIIVRPKAAIPVEFLLGVLQDERFRQHCRRHTSGTTVLHLASDALPGYPAPVVPPETQRAFAYTARPLIDRHDRLGRETERLVCMRDALLPELLSGRLRVPEARDAVAEVVAIR